MNIRGRVALAAAAAAVVAIPSMAMAGDSHRDNTWAALHAIKGGTARNVILLLGDGMGDSEITIARNYQVGANGRLAMDTLPLTGAYTTYAVQKAHPELPEYVTDSAASGTGWSTGHKTYNGAISVLPDGSPVKTILELAKKAGYRTGDVTTAELQDATPAVLASHVVDRGCKGPQSMAACAVNDKVNGGAGSIAEQLVQTRPDVLLGGGKAYFDQTVQAGRFKGQTVTDQARSVGYQVVTDATGLAAASWAAPILGAFAPNNMDLEWTGPTPTRTGTAPSTCATNVARNAAQPHLVDMTTKALDVLDRQTRHRDKGFFLQIEGASIDKQDHAANPCGQIGETVAFDAAIKKALDYQKKHPDTLVVVTADHGHTSQIVEAATMGYTATLVTHDNATMTISYATSDITGSQQHTGTEVRIAAGGPQAANVLGVTNQTDLFFTFKRALGIR
ncbi:alkaline phosphatase [Actinoplanes sp. SE50]|uniref:alkaline phosphatase n=1 Tax=unclassified Actinoplanes TaxID=2626549 RepID=UPI00023ECD9A|nr:MULTISPECIES: alkaline phosphatase [unclassified Actinoplanes]AEV87749.1 Alkaline phosphatase [Actinoplanes sp. SE50/110]ATO86151.1 alkaline phosphatase [Actinoplanes sp. SE50]SLM03565.1 alkaline phosphatase [Actinoplanes sp. SE50/110]